MSTIEHKSGETIMTTTTQLKFKSIPVEIQDVFECGGVKLAVVKSTNGMPFADGAKTTTKTAFKTVEFDEIEDCTCSPIDVMACPLCLKESEERWGDEIPF